MNPGSISTALSASGMPAAMIAITEQLPLSHIIVIGISFINNFICSDNRRFNGLFDFDGSDWRRGS